MIKMLVLCDLCKKDMAGESSVLSLDVRLRVPNYPDVVTLFVSAVPTTKKYARLDEPWHFCQRCMEVAVFERIKQKRVFFDSIASLGAGA